MPPGSDSAGAAGNRERPPLRVAYILHRFPSLTETFVAREMYWIRRHGVDVTIFSLMRPKHPASSEEARALQDRAHYSPGLSRAVVAAQVRFLRRNPVAYFRALARVIRQTYREPKVMLLALALFPKSVLFAAMMQDLDIQHVHANFVWLEGLAAGVVRDLVGITFTLQPHAFGLFGRNPGNVRNEIANASHVVTISEYHRSYITDLCPTVAKSDVSVVHCGVETNQITPPAERGSARPPRILSVGRAIEKKGHEYLIDACALLRDRGLGFECDIVVGDDDGRRRLQERIDGRQLGARVRLLGAHDQAELLGRYRSSDIFALACTVAADGDRDGIPVVLMEAMACELPVVTTPVAGIPELVRDDESGLLVPVRDAPALADALAQLLTDAEMRARLGKRGRQAVQSGFEAEANAAEMAVIFRRVASGPPARSRLSAQPVFNPESIGGTGGDQDPVTG
jgi:glycosyltransferase involved in cell wall biosynthesis